ncbi:PASTA domain-containing protein [Phycicoccus sp. CMS6Z-2]|uniref:PASTA domain-containing protein n=1 Tax=Phycicoccus flavus TaxID=2502783 RepID=A0A8T6R2K2_9MICO|nr:PASTA domain-containing protein [Phycicoccus flavus]
MAVVVPAVEGRTRREALEALESAGLTVLVTSRPSAEAAGTVLRQSVSDGTPLRPGERVRLVVASPYPKVPKVVGKTKVKGVLALRAAGFRTRVTTRMVPMQKVGRVLRTSAAADTRRRPGTRLTLVVGVPFPEIPAVLTVSRSAAAQRLSAAGFRVRTRTRVVESGTTGRVLSQSPAAGERRRPGSAVTLTVAKVVIPEPPPPPPSNCTDGYSPCLAPASDYDCAGGSGNGPEYATGPIRVTGSDPYDLDADGDGIACENG